MAGDTVARILGIFLGLMGIGLGVGGLLTTSWYSITLTTSGVSQTSSMGIYQSCANASTSSCTTLTFTDWTTGCTRTAADQVTRITAVRGLLIGGLSAALLSIILAGAAGAVSALGGVAVVFAFLSLGGVGSGVILFALTIEKWLYCDKNICSVLASSSTTCTSSFGLAFYMEAVCGGLTLLMMILYIAGAAIGPDPPPRAASSPSPVEKKTDDANTNEPTSQQDRAAPTETTDTQAPVGDAAADAAPPQDDVAKPATQSDETATQPVADAPMLPEGDWVLEPESGYYWSNELYFYYHPESGQFFDPNAGMWYDPATEEWAYP